MVDKKDIAEMVKKIIGKRSDTMENENFEELPVIKPKPVKIQQPTTQSLNRRDEKIFFKCMDCNFKFRAFEYRDRPRCPYCSNFNTVKGHSIFKELF